MTSTWERGQSGEKQASAFLTGKGHIIIATNFRLSIGEVDIISERDRILHFCEVKTWRTVPIEGLEQSVSRRKRQRIQSCASEFLRRSPEFDGFGIVFDVLFVDSGSGEITHIENAWTTSDVW
ncbi:MAG: YraN family protein [Spirochaetaceae bacterium]|nr:MAG: YraN family protein [Spirochaetaceae bacterium]